MHGTCSCMHVYTVSVYILVLTLAVSLSSLKLYFATVQIVQKRRNLFYHNLHYPSSSMISYEVVFVEQI